MCNFDIPLRVWVLNVFCERRTCFEQYNGYTFSKRLGWRPKKARVGAYLASRAVPSLMHSMGGIPVYRDSPQMVTTFKKTLAALLNGENVIIFPDIDYRDTSDDKIEFYDGYLLLDKMYRAKTKKKLPFVPLYVDEKGRRILKGEPVVFSDEAGDYAAQKHAVNEELIRQIRILAEQAEKIERKKAA